MIAWKLHHRDETISTNIDARDGTHGDVFAAARQTAGRGRLGHRWLSEPNASLTMSAVLSVDGLAADLVATLPLVAGLAVCEGVRRLVAEDAVLGIKWPNDVWSNGRKLSGILCERQGERVVVGIGVNVVQTDFPPELAGRATSLSLLGWAHEVPEDPVRAVRETVLDELAAAYDVWTREGFAAVWPRIAALDVLKGRRLAVCQTDDDREPVCGLCGGIRPDGALDVSGKPVYAGEAHVVLNMGDERERPPSGVSGGGGFWYNAETQGHHKVKET